MANINETTMSAPFAATELKFVTPTSTGTSQSYDIGLKDAEDMVFIIDARSALTGTFTVSFNAGEHPAAKAVSFSCAAGKAIIATLSTGEIKKTNGNGKFTLSGGTNLSTDGVKFAFVKRLFTVNH